MSFYRSFRSKDDLVCAYLHSSAASTGSVDEIISGTRCATQTVGTVRRDCGKSQPRRISRDAPSATLVEFPEEGQPAAPVIVRFRAERHASARAWQSAGARDPERLADQLGILLEGSVSAPKRHGRGGIAWSAQRKP